jgi:RNA polymerase sigma-70 factor (ECF subfamily)
MGSMGEQDAITADDATLITAIAAGDLSALRLLYDRHAPMLLARLRGRCRDSDLVDTALQDAFVAVWRKPDAWRAEGPVGAWLWGIAIRRLIDLQRRRPPRRPAIRPAVVASAEDRVLSGLEHGDLAPALSRLAPELVQVLQATVLDGLTTREAAQLLGIPRGTVKTRLIRARRELREALA